MGGQCLQHHGADLGLQPLLAIGGAVVVIDGKTAPLGANHRCPRQQRLERHAVQGGGHNQELEVIAQSLLALDGEGQRGVGVQAALVELIEDDQGDAGELGILLQHPGQHPLGNDLEPGLAAGAALAAYPQANALAHPLPELARQKTRDIARRQTSGFQHDDATGQPVLAHQLQRQQGRFARAGGRLQDHAGMVVDGGKECGQHRHYGERRQRDQHLLVASRKTAPILPQPARPP